MPQALWADPWPSLKCLANSLLPTMMWAPRPLSWGSAPHSDHQCLSLRPKSDLPHFPKVPIPVCTPSPCWSLCLRSWAWLSVERPAFRWTSFFLCDCPACGPSAPHYWMP